MQTFTQGDRVSWKSLNGTSKGKVVKKLTSDTTIKNNTVRASEKEPQYLVKSDSTGKKAAHKPESLEKISN